MRISKPILVAVLPFVQSQEDLGKTLEQYPSCAQPCIINAFIAQLCSPTDAVCICHDPIFRSNVTECVQNECTVIEALGVLLHEGDSNIVSQADIMTGAQNSSLTSCGAPVRDRSQEMVAHTFTMLSFAVLLATIRFGYKIVMRLDLGMDDWILLATAATLIPQSVLLMSGALPNGLGKDFWTLTSDQITAFLKHWYIVAIVYFLQTTLVKLAFIAFYMRIFTTRSTRRLLWATFVVVALWGFSFVLVAIFVCRPISYLWTQWDGLHEGQCLNDAAYVWSNAASNIALDIWVLAIPLWELRKLQLHWKKKVGVALMFGLGALVTAMSILRLKTLVLYQKRTNVTWEFAEVYLWSSIEIGVGIICACLPTLRLLLVKIWPVLAGSTVRNSIRDEHGYHRSGKLSQGSNSTASSSHGQLGAAPTLPSRGLVRSHDVSRTVSINGRNLEAWPRRHGEVQVDKRFVVQSVEGSEISLVLMNPDSNDRQEKI